VQVYAYNRNFFVYVCVNWKTFLDNINDEIYDMFNIIYSDLLLYIPS